MVVAATGGAVAPSLVTLNPGSNTLGILVGLGDGRFSNPVTLPTPSPILAAVTGDFNGDGVSDLAALGPGGLFVYLGNGRGRFSGPIEYNVPSDSTGLMVADVNKDGIPDLVVGNSVGDVLILQGKGDGEFLPYLSSNQDVLLAVLNPQGGGRPQFVFADQALDRVVVEGSGGKEAEVLADRNSGLLSPGAAVVADLNNDGLPDLIVANSGGNNVLVFPGLPGGGFGQELNGGKGFTVGTNPVGISVADLNGRPDLIVADEGSNDVTILLNEPTSSGFTFVAGPRLKVGAGPVSTAVVDQPSGPPDLLVSNGASDDVWVLPGRSDGFFDDSDPTIIPLGARPGQIVPINFGKPDPAAAVLLPDVDQVAMIARTLGSGPPEVARFSWGSLDPIFEEPRLYGQPTVPTIWWSPITATVELPSWKVGPMA